MFQKSNLFGSQLVSKNQYITPNFYLFSTYSDTVFKQ
jgi:hypothetical protein